MVERRIVGRRCGCDEKPGIRIHFTVPSRNLPAAYDAFEERIRQNKAPAPRREDSRYPPPTQEPKKNLRISHIVFEKVKGRKEQEIDRKTTTPKGGEEERGNVLRRIKKPRAAASGLSESGCSCLTTNEEDRSVGQGKGGRGRERIGAQISV